MQPRDLDKRGSRRNGCRRCYWRKSGCSSVSITLCRMCCLLTCPFPHRTLSTSKTKTTPNVLCLHSPRLWAGHTVSPHQGSVDFLVIKNGLDVRGEEKEESEKAQDLKPRNRGGLVTHYQQDKRWSPQNCYLDMFCCSHWSGICDTEVTVRH